MRYLSGSLSRNRERLQAKLPDDEFLVMVSQDFSLTKMLNMTDEFYETRVQPLIYNYIKERKYFQSNAAIALGNLGDPAFIPDLEQAMNDPEALVREYAAWALRRSAEFWQSKYWKQKEAWRLVKT